MRRPLFSDQTRASRLFAKLDSQPCSIGHGSSAVTNITRVASAAGATTIAPIASNGVAG